MKIFNIIKYVIGFYWKDKISLHPRYTESKFGSSIYAYVIERPAMTFKEFCESKQ